MIAGEAIFSVRLPWMLTQFKYIYTYYYHISTKNIFRLLAAPTHRVEIAIF